jgi:hypothetical protein
MPRVLFAVALAAVLVWGRPVRAEQALGLSVPAAGCPSRRLVEEQLAPLVGARPIEFAEASRADAVVRDEGDRYAIAVGPARREVLDGSRNCLERARVAAVFIAMNLPPAREVEHAAPNERARERDETRPAPEAAERERGGEGRRDRDEGVAVAAQVRFESSLAPEYGAVSLGVSVGPSFSWGAVEFGLLIGFSGPATLSGLGPEESESVELVRFPARLVLAYVWRAGALEVGPEIGGFAGGVRIRGDQVPGPETSFRLEGGPLGGAFLRWRPRDRFTLGASADMLLIPYRYELLVGPSRSLGETPALWLTGGISLAHVF